MIEQDDCERKDLRTFFVGMALVGLYREDRELDEMQRAYLAIRQADAVLRVNDFKPPLPIDRPFEKGEFVEVCDERLEPMENVRVTFAGQRVIRLSDKREFRAEDGWYLSPDGGAFPFPSIRHKSTS